MKIRIHLLAVGDKFRFPGQSEIFQVTSLNEGWRLYYKVAGYLGSVRFRVSLEGRPAFVERVGNEA
jgi:hypothetical protein